jgi:hypothetical protein
MRRLAVVLALAATLGALASLAPTPALAPACAGAGSYRAAIVVEHGDGSVVSRCVAFDAAEISGEELLNLSGLAWSGQTFGGFGQAVCALDGEPARYSVCPGQDRYWALFVARDVAAGGSWQLTSVGISSLVVHDGDAEGFRYVPASGTPAGPPSPTGVCAAATSAPHPTATASASATAPATVSAGATASASQIAILATPTAQASAAASPSPADQTPSPPSPGPTGPDPGLLAAAAAGGGLVGLAILRLAAGRRSLR